MPYYNCDFIMMISDNVWYFHFIRFNHPEQRRNKTGSGQEIKKDFEFANQELLSAQEKR